MVNTVPHPRTEHDEITDEDYYEARDLHHSPSKKAKAHALIIEHFWSRWKRKYLTSLREVHTSNNGSDKQSTRTGDVVIVHDDYPRLKW